MPLSIRARRFLVLILAFISLSVLTQAGPFNAIVVYGDSLSDNGNLFAASGQPPPPNFMGRRSDGPVAVEQLAGALGLPLIDFAWIGATTGIGNFADSGTVTSFGTFNLPGMQTQFAATQASLGPYLSNGLFIVWGGGNDFLAPSPLDPTPLAVAARAVDNLVGIATGLKALGAQNILAPGLPDLGLSPSLQGMGAVAAAQASALTDAFNAGLRSSLPPGVWYYDTSELIRNIVANPAAFGFTNVTDPCFNGISVCANPGQYLFWDDFHPTTATHSVVASAFAQTVPEPATFFLFAAGLAVLLARRSLSPGRSA